MKRGRATSLLLCAAALLGGCLQEPVSDPVPVGVGIPDWAPGMFWEWRSTAQLTVTDGGESTSWHNGSARIQVVRHWDEEGVRWAVARLVSRTGDGPWWGPGDSERVRVGHDLLAIDPRTFEARRMALPAQASCPDLDGPASACSWAMDWGNASVDGIVQMGPVWSLPLAGNETWRTGTAWDGVAWPDGGAHEVHFLPGEPKADGIVRLEGVLDPKSLPFGRVAPDDVPRWSASYDPDVGHFTESAGRGAVFRDGGSQRMTAFRWSVLLVDHGRGAPPSDAELIAGLTPEEALGRARGLALGGVAEVGAIEWAGTTVAPAEGEFRLRLHDGNDDLHSAGWRWEVRPETGASSEGSGMVASVKGVQAGVLSARFAVPGATLGGGDGYVTEVEVGIDEQRELAFECPLPPSSACSAATESPNGTVSASLHLDAKALIGSAATLTVLRDQEVIQSMPLMLPFQGNVTIPTASTGPATWEVKVQLDAGLALETSGAVRFDVEPSA